MSRTITVKGTGKVSAKPDYVVVSMTLESRNMEYEAAVKAAAESIELLNASLVKIGFEKDAIKTVNFNVHTDYSNERQTDGSYRQVFCGYVVTHDLKVEFDFDSQRLSMALSALGACPAHPQLSVAFTVKDSDTVQEEVLRLAAENAKRKAEILCKASGAELGELCAINYHWEELNVRSLTRYNLAEDCVAAPMMAKSIAFQPEDIHVSDTAAFVWEIK